MSHINKNDRSKFSKDEVAKIVIAMLSGIQLSPCDEKEFGDDICSYFVRTASFEDKKYKLVFCICTNQLETIGVITLHRVR